MGRITRYVLMELLGVFLITLAGMTLLMILVGLGQEAVRQGLGPGPILQLIPYVLPNALRFSVPGTILFAACSVYGRMAASNEVVAVKSIGVSPMRVLWPAIILAFATSLAAVWLNDLAVTWGERGVRRVVLQSVEQIVYGMLRTQRSYSTKKFSISVKRVEDHRLVRPTVVFHGSAAEQPVTLTAEMAELRSDPGSNSLSIFLTNGVIDVNNEIHMVFPDTIERVIPLSEATDEGGLAARPANLPLAGIGAEINAQRAQIRADEQALAADAAYRMMTGDFGALTDEEIANRKTSIESQKSRLFRLYTEPWRRWANGFSCLFFVLVGAPLAMQMRNSDLWTTFAVCFLPILAVYYPLLMFGVDRAKNGAMPPYTVWLGNVILFLVGCWLLRRACLR